MNGYRIWGVFLRYFYVARKGLYQLSDLFYWPVVDIFIWGLTSLWIQQYDPAGHLPLFLLTGLILWQVVWRGSVDISVSLLQEFWHRNLVNLFSTPLKLSEWLAGILLLSIMKLLITVAFGPLVVYFLYKLNVFSIGWMFLPFASALCLFGWALSFIAASAIIYWGHRVEMFTWMIAFIFAPFSAIFYPVEVLPSWAQTIAWCLPTTYIFQGMRSMLSGEIFQMRDLWMSMGLNAIYLSLSVALFCFAFEKSRQKGLARLE